jgi:oxalate decarboxylase
MTHFFKFSQEKPHEKTAGGSRTKANIINFPILKGLSLYKLELEVNGVREPHWHANADELGVCVKGSALINLYGNHDAKATFLVNEGDVFLIPSGALHNIENMGETKAEFILCFSHENVEDFCLSNAMGMFTNAVLGNTWALDSSVFKNFSRLSECSFASLVQSKPLIHEGARYESIYRYRLAETKAILSSDAGSVRMAKQSFWPILQNQALYTLILTDKGMREPHWHPETAELGFVKKGKGRMSILSPDGNVDTYIMEEGDIYFIPKAYPHHIENLSLELELLIFFDQPAPSDVGFTGSVRSFSDTTLGASTNNGPAFFNNLTKYYEDLFIVERINPVDKP